MVVVWVVAAVGTVLMREVGVRVRARFTSRVRGTVTGRVRVRVRVILTMHLGLQAGIQYKQGQSQGYSQLQIMADTLDTSRNWSVCTLGVMTDLQSRPCTRPRPLEAPLGILV